MLAGAADRGSLARRAGFFAVAGKASLQKRG